MMRHASLTGGTEVKIPGNMCIVRGVYFFSGRRLRAQRAEIFCYVIVRDRSERIFFVFLFIRERSERIFGQFWAIL